MTTTTQLTPRAKARKLNFDTNAYGSFAEIGAGQEVAAYFFKVGGASNTIAKTMSAYDMTFSNAIYGTEESGRYVCESRLMKMLRKEYGLLEQRLGIKKGFEKRFFALANTVTTINYQRTTQGHGWIGVRFQLKPQSAYNDLIIHVTLHDNDTIAQQQVLGAVGVNMIYACYYYHEEPDKLLLSLMDGLRPDSLEIDMLRLTGPDFEHVDNRLLSLQLVKNGFTNAAIFGPDGDVIQPSDFLYKKNILALRGRFRPVTHVNLDMLKRGYEQFIQEQDVNKNKVEILTELTLNDLRMGGEIDYNDFLDRVDILSSLGCTVMISNYQEYYKLVSYFSQFTKNKIGIVLGIYNLEMIFDEKYYEELKGGILESFSTLFSRNVKLYVYPAFKREDKKRMYTCKNFSLPPHQIDLYEYLVANNKLQDIEHYKEDILHIISDHVLEMIKNNDETWETMVPNTVKKAIKEKELFGYQVPKILEEQTNTTKINTTFEKVNQ